MVTWLAGPGEEVGDGVAQGVMLGDGVGLEVGVEDDCATSVGPGVGSASGSAVTIMINATAAPTVTAPRAAHSGHRLRVAGCAGVGLLSVIQAPFFFTDDEKGLREIILPEAFHTLILTRQSRRWQAAWAQ